jgi:hypothetical protein
MKQLGLGLNLSTKRTRKREFLDVKEGLMMKKGTVVDATRAARSADLP